MVNKVILIGNVGLDPELKQGQNTVYLRLPLATFQKINGQEKTEWHHLIFFGKKAEVAQKFLQKGTQIYVAGQLQTRSYEKDGQKQYFTNVVVQEMSFLNRIKPQDEKSNQDHDFGEEPDFDENEELPF